MQSIAQERKLRIPSFTGVSDYEVDLERGTCTCPAFRYRPAPDGCKHLRLARSGVDVSAARRGILADGTRVIVVDSVVHDCEPKTRSQGFQSRIWGWSWGEWDHALCFDGRRWFRESNRIGTGETRLAEVSPERWMDDMPVHCLAGKGVRW